MILDQKDDDVLSSFPEYRPQFDEVRRAFCVWLEAVKNDLRYMDARNWDDRKKFAEWAKGTTCPSIVFSAFNNEERLDGDWLEKQVRRIQISNLAIQIGIEERKEDKTDVQRL